MKAPAGKNRKNQKIDLSKRTRLVSKQKHARFRNKNIKMNQPSFETKTKPKKMPQNKPSKLKKN